MSRPHPRREPGPGALRDEAANVSAASPTDEISKAKVLLDAGTISPDEFPRLKSRVLV